MTSSNESGIRVAVVPARGGSKRIPRKNLVDFHGKPIIHWPLEMLVDSLLFDAVVVSTDDEDIARTASSLRSVEVLDRPRHLATDDAATAPVVSHALEEIAKARGVIVREVAVLYPTSVFATTNHLHSALDLLATSNVRMVMSVSRFRSPLSRAWCIDEAGLLRRLNPEAHLRPSQEFPPSFFDAGQFYVSDTRAWDHWAVDPDLPLMGYELPSLEAVDIDTESDLALARQAFSLLRLREEPR